MHLYSSIYIYMESHDDFWPNIATYSGENVKAFGLNNKTYIFDK